MAASPDLSNETSKAEVSDAMRGDNVEHLKSGLDLSGAGEDACLPEIPLPDGLKIWSRFGVTPITALIVEAAHSLASEERQCVLRYSPGADPSVSNPLDA